MVDDTNPGADSDLRRRAAWLLAMLVVVAVLFVVVMTTLINTGSGGGGSDDTRGALDNAATKASTKPSTTPVGHSSSRHSTSPASPPGTGSPTSPVPTGGATGCPTQQTCVLQGDVGGGVAAINDYRTQHGLPAVAGSVSAQAQTCAVHNGNGCRGGWAETELATPDGAQAVQKILPFAHLTETQLKSVEVGWAYDPSAKLYYFAIIRND